MGRIDSGSRIGRRPFFLSRNVEQDVRTAFCREPAFPCHLLIELARAPTRIAKRDDIAAGAGAFRNRLQYFKGTGKAPSGTYLHHVVAVPVEGMQHETSTRFNRPAPQNGHVRNISWIDVKAFKQFMQPNTLNLIAYCDTEGAVFVMDANGYNRVIKTHVFHARQCEQELTGIRARLVHYANIRCSAALPMAGCRPQGAMRHIPRLDRPARNADLPPINGRRQDMTIAKGDRIPASTFTKMTENGPEQVSSEEFFKGRTVALFSVPGAFTPTCSAKHLPGFVEKAEALKEKGVDEIACTAVNDVFVMGAWGKSAGADQKVTMLADGNGDFAKAVGLTMDGSKFGMGTRGQRFSMIVKDGVVTELNVEAPGDFKLSSADHMLGQL